MEAWRKKKGFMHDQIFARGKNFQGINDANIKKTKEHEKRIRPGLDKYTMAMFDSHVDKSKATKKPR